MEAAVERSRWLRRVAAWSQHRYGLWVLAAIAFADSSFLPVPPDLLLVPMALARPERIRLLLMICVAASSFGAVLGYLVGYGLWTTVGRPLVDLYGYAAQFASYQQLVAAWGVWIIIAKAFTPFPFKIAAIAAGVAAMNPLAFVIATVAGRALHFAMVGAVLIVFGPRLAELLARYERPFALVSVVLIVLLALVWHFR